MEINPQAILEDVQKGQLDKKSATDFLISLIDHSDNEQFRYLSLEVLNQLKIANNRVFALLENLLISDNNGKIRCKAVKYIEHFFLEKAIDLMKWAILHETDYDCLISIIKTLSKMDNSDSREILLSEIKRIRKIKYLDENKRIDNRKYRRNIKELIKSQTIDKLSHKELAEILINFITIAKMTQKFYSVYFELKNGLITKLDLADVEYEVRGWKADFKNNIKQISEIIGIENLQNITHLNVSNNQLQDIGDLLALKNISFLFLANNHIKDFKNLDYIKKMKKLTYLDLSGNIISQFLTPDDLPNLKVNLKKYTYF
ncbi:MAG: hypothetical protein EU539_06650 [Promethearchaeota archaeon]|nr:MAG: hypothetical protein EU539_06650 [Candidatus Lokiarchaeota archaeon]